MHISIITLFPDLFNALNYGVLGRAIRRGYVTVDFWNPRDFSTDKHARVDGKSYGGGGGMVMAFLPLQAAIHAAKRRNPRAKVIYLSPQGSVLDQSKVCAFAKWEGVILLNGRYEGIDARLFETEVDILCSIGDYVISGGEFAALVWIDAVVRCIKGVLGNADSLKQDSFYHHRLDYPHYTKPRQVAGKAVPDVLLSGNHAAIANWRAKESLKRTLQKRPDLFNKKALTPEELMILMGSMDDS